jgi:anaerobic magnesium-protoporphyrin IX monomethyl ester cyclase
MKDSEIDVLFLYPSYGRTDAKLRLMPERVGEDIPNQESPNIGFGYLIAVLKKAGIRAKFVDMVFDDYSVDDIVALVGTYKPALVGFTAFTVHIKPAGLVAEKIKSAYPDIKVCAGGPHVSAMPTETLDEFPALDFLVTGEAEGTIIRILDSLYDDESLSKIEGVVMRGRPSTGWIGVDDLDALPFPAWEEFELDRYGGLYPHRSQRELPMLAQRGCPYKCNFCMRASGETLRQRTVESVVTEIERNIDEFGCTSIAFLDETFALNKSWTKELFAAFKNRGINKKISWACSTRVSHTRPDLFEAMREAGCYYAFFGLESADDEVLLTSGKKITQSDMKRSINWAKEAGIIPVGAFIIGLPGDTEKSVYKAIDLGSELDLWSITFPIAVPYPGTELRTMAQRKKYGMEILSNDWDQYGKQEGGVLESIDLPWKKRKQLQDIAYSRHPKKNLDEYISSRLAVN